LWIRLCPCVNKGRLFLPDRAMRLVEVGIENNIETRSIACFIHRFDTTRCDEDYDDNDDDYHALGSFWCCCFGVAFQCGFHHADITTTTMDIILFGKLVVAAVWIQLDDDNDSDHTNTVVLVTSFSFSTKRYVSSVV
jgi:hypothetical protein